MFHFFSLNFFVIEKQLIKQIIVSDIKARIVPFLSNYCYVFCIQAIMACLIVVLVEAVP